MASKYNYFVSGVKTNYNFRFILLTTSVPYIQEQVSRPNATDIRETADQALMNIYQSLSNNQKRILKLLAKREL